MQLIIFFSSTHSIEFLKVFQFCQFKKKDLQVAACAVDCLVCKALVCRFPVLLIFSLSPCRWDLPGRQRVTYTRGFQLHLALHPHNTVPTDTIPQGILQDHQTHNGKKVTRRGKKKGGIRARLKRENYKHLALPNVHSLHNNTDKLQANMTHVPTASILAFTEMWLNKNDSDNMLHIDDFLALL